MKQPLAQAILALPVERAHSLIDRARRPVKPRQGLRHEPHGDRIKRSDTSLGWRRLAVWRAPGSHTSGANQPFTGAGHRFSQHLPFLLQITSAAASLRHDRERQALRFGLAPGGVNSYDGQRVATGRQPPGARNLPDEEHVVITRMAAAEIENGVADRSHASMDTMASLPVSLAAAAHQPARGLSGGR